MADSTIGKWANNVPMESTQSDAFFTLEGIMVTYAEMRAERMRLSRRMEFLRGALATCRRKAEMIDDDMVSLVNRAMQAR